jgi:hypothetical protein
MFHAIVIGCYQRTNEPSHAATLPVIVGGEKVKLEVE